MIRNPLILIGLGSALAACSSMGWHTYANAPRGEQIAASRTNAALVCKDLAPTGSRLVHRECHTQAEWDTLANDSMTQFNQDTARSSPMTDPGSASGH